ncbi:MAG: extracellular solute-binding protein [Oscillospiraceae bacterium]|nr:extracellular solute-binding protein [Oscillospiraceae bacterium]
MRTRSSRGISGYPLLLQLSCILLSTFFVFTFACGCAPTTTGEEAAPPPSKGQAPTALSIFINHPWYAVDSFAGIIPEEITRLTGITLDVEIAVDSQQLGLKIASSDLPDLVYTSTMIDRLSNESLSYCYDDLIGQYGVEWEIDPILRANAIAYSSNGKLYTVLNHYTSTEDWAGTNVAPMTGSMLIRKDILDALGSPPISTFEELMDVYGMVKQKYPDMIPMTFSSSHRFNVMLSWIGLGTVPFIEQTDGTYLYYIRDERYKELMRILNRMYQNGYIVAENFAAETSQQAFFSSSPYNSGRSFSNSACTQDANISAQASLTRINPSYLTVEMEPLAGSAFNDSNLGWSATFITKANRNPSASIEFMRWMFSPEAQKLTQWGREGIEYTLGATGLPEFSKDVLDSIADDTYVQKYNPWFYLGGSAIYESEGRCALLPWDLYEKPYTAIKNSYTNLAWITAALPINGSAEKEIFKRVGESVQGYESKVILSASDMDFEGAYSEYMKSIELMDVVRLEAYMTLHIPEYKTKYEANKR